MSQKTKYLSSYGKKESLKKFGVVVDKCVRNKLVLANKDEKKKHFFCKAACFYVLISNSQTCVSEAEVKGGIADIFWLERKAVIEFERVKNSLLKMAQYQSEYVEEVFVFRLSEIPDDWDDAVFYLERQLGL